MKNTSIFLFMFMMVGMFVAWIYLKPQPASLPQPQKQSLLTPSLTPSPTPLSLPDTKVIKNDYQVFQTYNNCGPAALSMTLSYYGINVGQDKLGQELRPFQNPQGDNDDKSVTLAELAQKGPEYNLIPFHRPNGSINLIKQFIAQDIPVITRTLLQENDDIGHYRVVKGFDDVTGELVQDDSLQGHDMRFAYGTFMKMWRVFNYEYLVFVPPDKEQIALRILGEDSDAKAAWEKAVITSENSLKQEPDDIYTRFNLSIALFHRGDLQRSITEFERVEGKLPSRTLWYQIEPIQAYYESGNYKKAMSMIESIINNQNRAFSELYIIRGEIYKKQGNPEAAKQEFEKAVLYNANLPAARSALKTVE